MSSPLLKLTLFSFLLGSSQAQLPPGNWQYVWGDEFSGDTLDLSKWSYHYPWGTTHNHDATMSANNVIVGDGTLTLVARRTGPGADFTSGAVTTGYSKKRFSSGYLEARILLPSTPGSWPAFWGLNDGWPPECDIMEYPIDTAAGVGYARDQYHTAFHYRNRGGGNSAGAGQVNPAGIGNLDGSYHTFGLHWIEDDYVGFYFDGQLVSSFTDNAAIAQMTSMYLILNYAVGGWPGRPDTSEWPVGHRDQTKIDWVRAWTNAPVISSEWQNNTSGEYALWDTGSHWSHGIPNRGGITAYFGTIGSAAQRIDWNGTLTVTRLHFDGSTRYRLGWPDDRLTLGFGNGGSIPPRITLAQTTTTGHEISGQLEWPGNLEIENNSNHPLLLNSSLAGGDGLRLNGPGVVRFNSENSCPGTTVIDSGTAGPAIARVSGTSPLGTGPVIIGERGNATTARLELEHGASLPNPISLNGRNNNTPGIVSLSGQNTLEETISANVGGSTYHIRSDEGHLTLAGNPALRSSASGTRTFTLAGTSDGSVEGAITNGSATVNLVKDGSGTWSLQGTQSYTGSTTVNAGTLRAAGSLESSVTIGPGATLRIGPAGLTPAFSLIDDFESHPPGAIGAVPNTTKDQWVGVFNGTNNAQITPVDGNKALRLQGINSGDASWRGALTDLGPLQIGAGNSATCFFRIRSSHPTTADFIFGLTDHPVTTTVGSTGANDWISPWNELAVTLSVVGGNLRAFSAGSGHLNVTPIAANQWTNVWVIVNHSDQTFRVATSVDSAPPILAPTTFQFGRRNAQTVNNQPLTTFAAYERTNNFGWIDDLSLAPGMQLANPLLSNPLVGQFLRVNGALTLEENATLELDLHHPPTHDQLTVEGPFQAAGTLKLNPPPISGLLSVGQSFQLFNARGANLNFASLDLPALAPGLQWDSSQITSGLLAISLDPHSYAGWIQEAGLPAHQAAFTQDPDGDGLPNAFEWLLNGNPRFPDPHLLPTSDLRQVRAAEFPGANPTRKYLTLRALVRKNLSGATLTAQAASHPANLNHPSSSDHLISKTLEDRGAFELREWIHTIPIEQQDNAYLRLKITLP